MTNRSQDCPFGHELDHYWARLSAVERHFALDHEALYSLDPQEVFHPFACGVSGATVIDAFCGAGGAAIAFARAGKRVASIERSRERLAMARHNATLYEVESAIEFIEGDSCDILQRLRADVVFLDPPWGGADFKEKDAGLTAFKAFARQSLVWSAGCAPLLLLKVPKSMRDADVGCLLPPECSIIKFTVLGWHGSPLCSIAHIKGPQHLSQVDPSRKRSCL